ncbi:MAG: hypothetical protein JXB39_09225, partial [Deltaproteobacteria bacterium]|nr:hypothetical protein [Deltaproteobacteria bacterium]
MRAILCRTLVASAFLLAIPACGTGVRSLYEKTRAEALADPGPVPPDWTPDAVLGLAWPLVEDLVGGEVSTRLTGGSGFRVELPLDGEVSATPDLSLEALDLSPDPSCVAYARLESTIVGRVRLRAGPTAGDVPVRLALAATLELETRSSGKGHTVEGVVRAVEARAARGGRRVGLDAPLASWLAEQFDREAPRIRLATLGAQAAPVRAVRLVPEARDLRVDLLTEAPGSTGGPPAPPGETCDWYLSVRTASLLGLARRAAFDRGDLGHGVHADPRALAVEGDRFTLDLRLWRLAGLGWWRDYRVNGEIRLEDGRIRLEPSVVTEGEHSSGAGVLDPLVLLARGAILEAVSEGLRIARPAEARLGSSRLRLEVDRVAGRTDSLVIMGDAGVGAGRRGGWRL